MEKVRKKIISWLLSGEDFLLVRRRGEVGCVMSLADSDGEIALSEILATAMDNGQDVVKRVVLGGAEVYLKPLEIESRDFINKIK